MAYRVLQLTLVSASDLKKVTLFSRMRVYAVTSISGSNVPMPIHGTNTDHDGGRNPAWNALFHFPIPATADTRSLALYVLLRSERTFGADRDIGEVFVPLDDLVAGAAKNGEPRTASYQVRRPMSGRAHDVLYFCYKFTDVWADAVGALDESTKGGDKGMYSPVTAYPPPQNAAVMYPPVMPYRAAYAGYPPPPPQQQYGYAAPPPYGYNAGPAPAMYGGGYSVLD